MDNSRSYEIILTMEKLITDNKGWVVMLARVPI
jgi:hypothetical protein